MLIPVNAIYVTGLKTETRNKFFSEVGISHNDCTKTMFVNLITSENEQLIQRLAQLVTNCFEIRSVVKGLCQG